MRFYIALIFIIAMSAYQSPVNAGQTASDKQFLKLMNLGIREHDSGKFMESINTYEKALKIKNSAWAWYEVGYSLVKMKDDDNAAIAFDKAVEINPNYYKAYDQLGYLFAKHGRPDVGNALYFKSYLIEPKSPVSLNNIAINLDHLGISRTLEFYRLILDRYPDNKLILFNLTEIYSNDESEILTVEEINKRDNYKRTVIGFEKLRKKQKVFNDKELDYYVALVHLSNGHKKEGRKYMDICAKSNKKNVRARCLFHIKNGYRLISSIEQKTFIERVRKQLARK